MKVGDLTVEELKEIIGKIIEEKLKEILDPDIGLELRDDFVQDLETSLASSERIPMDEVKKKLGLR